MIQVGTYQLKSTLALPPNYIADTGVVVGGTNVPPGNSQSTDPCIARRAPIQATQFSASMTCVNGGRSVVVNVPVSTAPPGTYQRGPFTFGLNPQAAALAGEEISEPTAFINF